MKYFQVSLLLLLFVGCFLQQSQRAESDFKENKKGSMETTIINRNKETVEEREYPFIIRKFNPSLNGKWIGEAISYGCYRAGQSPMSKGPSKSEILQDLKIILSHWNLIRLYGSDEDSERILKVISENNLPIKVMLGVWLENEKDNPQRKIENHRQVTTAVRLANEYPEIIPAINVGNETQVFWSAHKLEIEKLIQYLRIVRNHAKVPVTTADDYNFWNRQISKTVADEVDFIVVHIYPLWNGQTLENSIDWMNNIFNNEIKKIHSEKTIVLGEIGWATNYDSTKIGEGQQGSLIKGQVSYTAQESFLKQLSAWVNKYQVTTFLFEAFDEPWKGGGEYSSPNEIEKHWGVFYENRTPKKSFYNYLQTNKNNNEKY